MTHSQRLAKAVPIAIQGDPAAFAQLRESRDRLTDGIVALDKGGTVGTRTVPATGDGARTQLVAVQTDWKDTQVNASVILDNEKLLTSIGATLRALNDATPALVEAAKQSGSQAQASDKPQGSKAGQDGKADSDGDGGAPARRRSSR